jgi:aminopeptidase
MTEAVRPLEKIMTEGKSCRISSPSQDTDLSFSIEGLGATPCTGERNIPDGECFTAPVKDSINGTIKFGPSNYDGQRFAFIKLTFKNGRIESAEAENAERTAMLNGILDTDAGARYIGEFSINFNPYVKHPTGSILFDEKIDGGIHMAAGRAYEGLTDNGNRSASQWDMVHIQRADYGGGQLWIDDRLIREDGRFVVPELQGLNPEQLASHS